MNRLASAFSTTLGRALLRWLLPALLLLLLLLAQHGVWAHGFAHDLGKITGHTQNDARHDCCLPFQAAGDAACVALPQAVTAPAASDPAHAVLGAGCAARPVVPYASRAPPLYS